MSNEVKKHYDSLLAGIYSWMVGDFDSACQNSTRQINQLDIPDATESSQSAWDLGCGHGLQTMAFLKKGYSVASVDFSDQLLEELRQNTKDHPVKTFERDLIEFLQNPPSDNQTPSIICCMGDTITHLPHTSDVQQLLELAHQHLEDDGTLVLSFRNYFDRPLVGTDRFITVRSEEKMIHQCFLEYHDHTVNVHDILHTRTADTQDCQWQTQISSYPKLRIDPQWLKNAAGELGFDLKQSFVERGMEFLAFTKRR